VLTDLSADSIEERIRRLEHRFAIMDLVANYCAGIDNRDLDRFVSCFTEDAVLRHQDGVLSLTGRDAIHEYYSRRFRDYGATIHCPHSNLITVKDDSTATGVVTGHAEMGLDGEGWIAALRYTGPVPAGGWAMEILGADYRILVLHALGRPARGSGRRPTQTLPRRVAAGRVARFSRDLPGVALTAKRPCVGRRRPHASNRRLYRRLGSWPIDGRDVSLHLRIVREEDIPREQSAARTYFVDFRVAGRVRLYAVQ
jgi:ketosteroid isomerase-like protein